MSQILVAQLNAAKFFVGPDLIRLEGAGDDYFEITQGSDVGSSVSGIQGDVMLIVRNQNQYNATLTLVPASSAVAVLLSLAELGVEFPVKIAFNAFSFVGVAIVQNVGSWVASGTAPARTISLIMVRQSGDVTVGIGRVAIV